METAVQSQNPPSGVVSGISSKRLLSLDVFRGLTIAFMIIVNDPGSWSAVYWPLEHAEWNGWTPTDMVFPFFLFIVGTSMVFSFASRRERGATRRELLRHTFRRSVYIYGIGLALHLYPFTPHRIENVRIMGVLARIALCYFIGALIYLYTSKAWRLVVLAACLIAYYLLMKFVPVPGFGAGDMSPFGSVASYVDRWILGTKHLWKPMWDPEGLLSSMPAIGTLLLGCYCGEWLREARSRGKQAAGLLVAGIVGIVAAYAVNPYFPINKNLWTSTFVLFMAGWACVALAALFWAIDIRGWKRWAWPIEVFGANAILAYALATFLAKQAGIAKIGRFSVWDWVYQHSFARMASPKMSSLLFALAFTALNWAVMYAFYRKRIFLKV